MKILTRSEKNLHVSTGFSRHVIRTTAKEIADRLGIEYERFDEKVDFCWYLELEDGTPFTIYAWVGTKCITDQCEWDYHIGTVDQRMPDKLKDSLNEIGLTVKKF